MYTGIQPSWRLNADAPMDLNFAVYVACSFDLIPDTPPFSREQMWSAYCHETRDVREQEALVGQWLQWWNDLVVDRARMASDHEGGWSKHFAPNGRFDGLEEPLRTRCEEVFRSFSDWWGHTAGGQQGVNYWVSLLDFHSIVYLVENEIAAPVRPFELTVDFVYTGLANVVDVHPTYAMMSVHQPTLSVYNKEWWLAKVRELA
ncbi:hypothetical protein [Alicyclobacillus acidiphilus]|uniref:hypothetical protein n=1 Tax=Alicyclobacillus acidiphilus TaxID=182455 RepID=UPI000835F9E7|nr:hypothetical protein [Alicyclobacillus acidiphilus]